MTSSESADGQRPVLLVLADSLSYFGPKGGLAADHPRIWPNIVADELGWDVELVARIGWTCRDAWWALTQDPRVWAAVPRAGAVVFAVGGMDSLPSPLPTALRETIRYVRPPEGPMTQTTSPLLMSTSRPLRTSLSPNDFFSPLTEILTSVSDLPMLTAVSVTC